MEEPAQLNPAANLVTSHPEVTSRDPPTTRPTAEDFMKDLQAWQLKENGEVSRVPVFSRKELDLAQLWSVVQEVGGSEKVCVEKRWAWIGRLFDPPKNMTNLSFHIKRLYEKHLLPYERANYPGRAMTVENEQINACRKRTSGDDYYEFDPIIMEPVPVSGSATARDPHSSESPASTPTVFTSKGISFKNSLLEWDANPRIRSPQVAGGEVLRIIRSEPLVKGSVQAEQTMQSEKAAVSGQCEVGKQMNGHVVEEVLTEQREWEQISAEKFEAWKRLKDAQDAASSHQRNSSEQVVRQLHPGRCVREEVFHSLAHSTKSRQHGLKPVLTSDAIADADKAVKANLQPLNVPGKPVVQKKCTIQDISQEAAIQKLLDQMRLSHAREVDKLKQEIEEYRKQLLEIEIAQKVAEAVAEESRRCFQQLLHTTGIARVMSGGARQWGSGHPKSKKRELDRSSSDMPSKRQNLASRGFILQ